MLCLNKYYYTMSTGISETETKVFSLQIWYLHQANANLPNWPYYLYADLVYITWKSKENVKTKIKHLVYLKMCAFRTKKISYLSTSSMSTKYVLHACDIFFFIFIYLNQSIVIVGCTFVIPCKHWYIWLGRGVLVLIVTVTVIIVYTRIMRNTTTDGITDRWKTGFEWLSVDERLELVCFFVCLMMFNATFNNISVISWRSVLLVEETGGSGENHRPVASHWQTISHNVVHLALIEIRTQNISGDRHGLDR
jgi:hypothetical protein